VGDSPWGHYMSEDQKPSFWNSFAGLITAIAALVTAVGGVIALVHSMQTSAPTPPSDTNSHHPATATTPRVTSTAPEPESPSPLVGDGTYQLYTWQGAPQKSGLLLKLQRVTGDRYLANFSTPAEVGYTWAGELQHAQNSWTIAITSSTPGNAPWAQGPEGQPGSRFNPSGSGYDIAVAGPLLTFRNGTNTYVWRKLD
jgi:hypothetical protein